MAGDIELTGSDQNFDEFSATDSSPTYVVSQRRLNHIRRYISFNLADPGYGATSLPTSHSARTTHWTSTRRGTLGVEIATMLRPSRAVRQFQ